MQKKLASENAGNTTLQVVGKFAAGAALYIGGVTALLWAWSLSKW